MTLKIEKNVSLKNFSTFKIGGKAKYFCKVKKREDLFEILKWAKKKKIPFFILGGGSNVLFSDKGFKGLVIKIEFQNFKFLNSKLFAEAGCPLMKLVLESVKRGKKGLEWAAGIPGTLGGAIVGNAGAFGKEMKDVVEKVEVLKIKKNKIEILNFQNKDCQFGYRESKFKREKDLLLLSATLKLKKGKKKILEKKIKEILKKRKEKYPLSFPSAGCIFKNVPLKNVPKKFQEVFKDKIQKKPILNLPAAIFIEKANLKGLKIGRAQVSKKHANFIVNLGEAKAKDVLELIKKIKKKVKEKFKVELEEEIILVGF